MTERLPFDLTTVVADAIAAAGDDTNLVFTRRAAEALADRLIDHLNLLGCRIVATDHRPPAEDP